jgi:hypothetical protein
MRGGWPSPRGGAIKQKTHFFQVGFLFTSAHGETNFKIAKQFLEFGRRLWSDGSDHEREG